MYYYVNIVDINSKSSDNTLVIGIVIGILGTVIFVSLTAGFYIALYIVHTKKKGLYDHLRDHK